MLYLLMFCLFFFFNDTATTEIYTLSLHDALPICRRARRGGWAAALGLVRRRRSTGGRSRQPRGDADVGWSLDRKSTRLNSSHANISYAVFCLKKKKKRT